MGNNDFMHENRVNSSAYYILHILLTFINHITQLMKLGVNRRACGCDWLRLTFNYGLHKSPKVWLLFGYYFCLAFQDYSKCFNALPWHLVCSPFCPYEMSVHHSTQHHASLTKILIYIFNDRFMWPVQIPSLEYFRNCVIFDVICSHFANFYSWPHLVQNVMWKQVYDIYKEGKLNAVIIPSILAVFASVSKKVTIFVKKH